MDTAFFAEAARLSDDRGEFNVGAVCRLLNISLRAGRRFAGRLVAEGMARPVSPRQYHLTQVGATIAHGYREMISAS